MNRYDLTDFEWSVIEPLLPNKPRGVPRVDDRRVLRHRPLQPICRAARYVGQHAQPIADTSFFSKVPDIIFSVRFV